MTRRIPLLAALVALSCLASGCFWVTTKAEGEKIDTWVRQLSLAAEKDLRPFHLRWGWPLGEGLRRDAALDALPKWDPDPTDLDLFDRMGDKD